MLSENTPAPAFTALASDGKTYSLTDFKGQNVVLYFYPKDDTPGCTVEACGFRDAFFKLKKHAAILGVSPDSVKKHEKFIAKYDLPFLLLSDEDHNLCEAYGVWVEKSLYGRKYMGVTRTTFVIEGSGNIVRIFEKVKPETHAEEILETLNKLAS